jgi:hypothetical protein
LRWRPVLLPAAVLALRTERGVRHGFAVYEMADAVEKP